eukprot:492539-Rhodomonas_salina.1
MALAPEEQDAVVCAERSGSGWAECCCDSAAFSRCQQARRLEQGHTGTISALILEGSCMKGADLFVEERSTTFNFVISTRLK